MVLDGGVVITHVWARYSAFDGAGEYYFDRYRDCGPANPGGRVLLVLSKANPDHFLYLCECGYGIVLSHSPKRTPICPRCDDTIDYRSRISITIPPYLKEHVFEDCCPNQDSDGNLESIATAYSWSIVTSNREPHPHPI